MAWKAYKIVLRLRSPLHIGAGKVGNLQRTRHYLTGRNLWGALTAQLTRAAHPEGKPDPKSYQEFGDRIHTELAFTYFYPTTQKNGYAPLFPDYDEQGQVYYGLNGKGMPTSTFRYKYLSTYASTALNYATVSAEEASLHEVECLLPNTRLSASDENPSERVYLTGYIFQEDGSDLNWESAMGRLQIGGERGYGWGRLQLFPATEIQDGEKLFGTGHTVVLDEDKMKIRLKKGQPLLAHTLAEPFGEAPSISNDAIKGPVEPLVGRETKLDTRFGVNLSAAQVCYIPGARVIDEELRIQIGNYGIWEAA